MGRIVSIVHYSALPVIGGVEFIISKHRELLGLDGMDVRLIAGEGEPDVLIPELKASYYKKIQEEILKGREPDNYKSSVISLKEKLWKVISPSDVLIVHNIFTMHFNLVATAALALLIKDIRTIAWVHDISYLDPTYNLPSPLITPLKYITELQEGLEYIAITQYRKEKLVNFLSIDEDRVTVIPNGIDPYMPLPPRMRKVAREFDILSYYPVLIYPARLTRRKNFEFAIEITGKLGGNPLLVLSAPPDPHNPAFSSYKNELLKLSREKRVSLLFFSDYCPIEEIYPFYYLGDILLVSSRMEGFGLPAIESALMRIPAALSSIPPLRELASDFQNIIFFDLKEGPGRVADRITSLLKKSPALGDRHKVIERYSWQRIYEEKIKNLLQFS